MTCKKFIFNTGLPLHHPSLASAASRKVAVLNNGREMTAKPSWRLVVVGNYYYFIGATDYFRSIYLQFRDTYHAILCAHFAHFWNFVTLFDETRLQKTIYPNYKMLLCGFMNTARSSSRLVSDLIFNCHDNTLWSITCCLSNNLGHPMVYVHQ